MQITPLHHVTLTQKQLQSLPSWKHLPEGRPCRPRVWKYSCEIDQQGVIPTHPGYIAWFSSLHLIVPPSYSFCTVPLNWWMKGVPGAEKKWEQPLSAVLGSDWAEQGLWGGRKDGTTQDTGLNLSLWLKVTKAQEHTQRLLYLMGGWLYCTGVPLYYWVAGQSRALPHQGTSAKSLEILLLEMEGPQLLDSESRWKSKCMNRVYMGWKRHKLINVTENQGLLFILPHNAKARQY